MKIITVIPARSGSKGVPNKNIKELAGKPLITYSIMVAQKTKLIDRIIVSTDSEKYASLAKEYGAEIPFIRPEEYADDSASDFDVINHLLDWLLINEGQSPDMLVYLRPDFPFRKSRTIDMAIEQYKNHDNADGLRSVHESVEIPYKMWLIENNYLKEVVNYDNTLMPHNQPRQIFPKTYYPNGYIDIYDPEMVMKRKTLHGSNMIPFIIPEKWGVSGIGSLDDLKKAEATISDFGFY